MRDLPLQIFASDRLPPDPDASAALRRIAALDDVAQVVALPDLHIKAQLETPSSTAVATRDTIILGLSSPSPNCAMALARTSLFVDDLDNDRLDAFFAELTRRMPLKRQSPRLTLPEMNDVLLRGGAAAVERYGLAPAVLQHIDQQGNALPPDSNAEAVLKAVPPALREIGRVYFALIGRGNHFLELQVVDEIVDEAVARAWELRRGQVVAMYHADSGYLGAFIGRLYAWRRKNSWRGRVYEWKLKLPFQVTAGSPHRLLRRINYHLLPRWLTPVPADSPEGQRALLAIQAAGNYAYANRVAILANLGDALRAVWGEEVAAPDLLWDAPHNSIRRETISGQNLWVHRHNAACVTPPSCLPAESPFAQTGHPVLLPGLERTSSYLCASDEGAANTLHSADHGAGRSVLQLGQALNSGRATRVYTYQDGLAKLQSHLSDDGLEEVLTILKTHRIARPVVRLRPIAVLKGPK